MSEPKMKLSQEQAEEMQEFALNHKMPLDKLKEILREHYFKPYMTRFKEDGYERAKQVILVVKAQINAYQGSGEDIEGVVVDVTKPTTYTSKAGTDDEKVGARASVIGIFEIDGEKKLINITAFDEAIENIKSVPRNVPVMLTNVAVKSSEQYGKQYTLFDTSGFHELECEEGFHIDMITEIEAIYEDEILDPDAAKLDVGEGKIVRARIKDVQVRVSKNTGKPYGSLRVYDDSVNDSDLKENPRQYTFSINCDAGMAIYDTGSLCYFIGDIRESNDEQYPPSMWASMIVPILPIPRDEGLMQSEIENAKRKTQLQTQKATIEDEDDDEEVDEDDPLHKWDK